MQVFPALDPSTKVYAPGFAMQLIRRRMQEYSLWDESRFHTFKMKDRFDLGPFRCFFFPFCSPPSQPLSSRKRKISGSNFFGEQAAVLPKVHCFSWCTAPVVCVQ